MSIDISYPGRASPMQSKKNPQVRQRTTWKRNNLGTIIRHRRWIASGTAQRTHSAPFCSSRSCDAENRDNRNLPAWICGNGRFLAYHRRNHAANDLGAKGRQSQRPIAGDRIPWRLRLRHDRHQGNGRLTPIAPQQVGRFLRFDYSGHGRSSGKFTDGTIGQWRDDALQRARPA